MKPIILLTLLALLSACGKSTPPPAAKPETPSTLDQVLGVSVPATENMSIAKLKPTLKEGDQVTLEAKVMGTMHPFVENRAVVIVGDEEVLTSCDLKEDDHCSTPWDVCCDSPESIQKATATLQILDQDGVVVKESLKGQKGLKELSRIRVRGEVASDPSTGALVVNASAIELL